MSCNVIYSVYYMRNINCVCVNIIWLFSERALREGALQTAGFRLGTGASQPGDWGLALLSLETGNWRFSVW